MALNGSLDDYSPAGALRVLSSTGKTGAVRFTGSAGCTVYLNEGLLYFARGEGTDDALATALVRPGRVSTEAWGRAVEEAGDAPRVGELLVEHAGIDADLMASVVLSVIYDPLITLFREGDGRFDFEPDTMHWIGPYRGFNVEAVVNEVRRRVRHVDEMSDVVPSTSAWVSPVRTLPDGAAQVTLLREDWELIASLSGPRTVDELAAAMGRGRYSTAMVVHRLAVAGLLDVVPEPFADDDAYHEPSAAERLAAAGDAPATSDAAVDLDGDATDAGAPTGDPFAPLDPPVGNPFAPPVAEVDVDVTTGDDAAWDAWSAGNPFDHPPTDDEADEPVSFGPTLDGGSVGPEAAPDDDLLPRRTAVREADRPSIPHRQDDVAPGLAGITGFHDPTARSMGHQQDDALSAATSADTVGDPNAAWLENLYAQFIDEAPEVGKPRKKDVLDVAFQAPEQADTEKVGTLKRLAAALRRL
ncbi:DUF4388 domain-containing protein [Iamia sp. SCSIO 61187]|uniref:DUF4388 domain-containing protein n=1 Tax=Iamia sp. SCSIO 61187 TaxID=2722752 RepID=UPI001C63A18A|nr:DUF4388 domain-containing protein [Iamia sp. SCSIO 61187]QYG94564.1 DUF4388 domain-containing protein [Iamia sp. SCSIO 61187]